MPTETPTRRTVVILSDEHHRRLETAANERSSAIRRVSMAEVIRTLIDQHLPPSAGQDC